MDEEWRSVVGYEGLYQVSNLGRIKSNYVNRIIKGGVQTDGYAYFAARKDGCRKNYLVHRAVAEAFIPNPDGLPLINHKDENPLNNNVENLEWCTYLYNNTYNDSHIKKGEKMAKSVYCYDSNGDLVQKYNSLRAASKSILNGSSGDISECCNEKQLTHKNFVWSYVPLSQEEVLEKFKKSLQLQNNIKNNRHSKEVDQFDLDGNFIKHYPSTHEVERSLGFSASLVAGVCRGEHKSTHGFIFKYTN